MRKRRSKTRCDALLQGAIRSVPSAQGAHPDIAHHRLGRAGALDTPHRGADAAGPFHPLFEKNGFIIRLDEYIWEQACITLRRWIDHGLTPTPISVNMSRMHIHDPRLREKLLDLMRRYELPPHLLELELTESAFLENESGLFGSMKALRAFGFQFSMDDFGSGYSSLNMLKSMPWISSRSTRGFLNEVVTTERGKTVIRFSISLAREMASRSLPKA